MSESFTKETVPAGLLDPAAAKFYMGFEEGFEYRVHRIQDSITIEKHPIVKEDADNQDPVLESINNFYEVAELAINELRESVFEIGLWREHNVESSLAVVQDALTMHRAVRVVREILDPREDDPGNHPDSDRPPGTSGSWGEA